jgi:oligopeptide/dipeptide ABC transporter ATP-binding protein
MTEGPIIEVSDLHVEFEARGGKGRGAAARAVDGVDLEIMPGEIVALVGESGCGKTTLARTLLGLELPASGEVRFQGTPLPRSTKALRKYRRNVQIVFQDPTGALNPRQTIYESVAEGLRIHKVEGNEKDLVADALARSGLRPPERFFQRYPHEISGGQRQRVVIAGAIALDPWLIVADEPVASLDASVRGEILRLMLGLVQETEVALLVVTHDLGLAWNIADRIAVMYLGRIVELGTTEEVLEDPKHPYTRALLSVVPEIERMEPEILRGEPPDPTKIPEGCRFHPRCPVVASGEAERLGILERCRTVDPERVGVRSGHSAACHAANLRGVPGSEPAEAAG